jgi:hypothetical protein
MIRSRAGWVYCQSNAGLIGYKIGRTIRCPAVRANENTRGYGTAYPFVVASKHMVSDCVAVETLAHRRLADFRIDRSEMFECDLKTAQAAIAWAAKVVLRRAWYWRLWYRLVLPRPMRAPKRWRRARHSYREWLVATLLAAPLIAWLIAGEPDLPAWMPAPVLYTAQLARSIGQP